MLKRIIILLAMTPVAAAHAQGCSDAGVCTAGALRQDPVMTTDSKHTIALSSAFGWGDDNVSVITPALQYSFVPRKGIAVQAKLSANSASGKLGCVSGLGDILLDVVKVAGIADQTKLSLVAGIKIPLSKSDLEKDGLSLPMQYQSSLGTYDAILGATLSYKKWLFSLGYQQPLSGTNNNMFLPARWPPDKVKAYPRSYLLYRRADVIAKTGYNLISYQRWKITPGVLVVLHTGEDKSENDSTKQQEAIKGSAGATVNLTLNISYTSPKWTFGLLGGRPIVVRDIRPDGLTRSLALLPEISYKF